MIVAMPATASRVAIERSASEARPPALRMTATSERALAKPAMRILGPQWSIQKRAGLTASVKTKVLLWNDAGIATGHCHRTCQLSNAKSKGAIMEVKIIYV
jgi:hypothetical protein